MRNPASSCLPLISLLVLPIPLAEGQVQDFAYYNNGSSVTIGGYTGPGGAVIIPDNINGLPVTGFYDYAFRNLTNLTSVSIPNSVAYMGGYGVFYGCTRLTHVTMPNSLTSIPSLTFYGCSSLTNVAIPNRVTHVSGAAFYGCTSLESVTIPDSVTLIDSRAFQGCASLASVAIPSSVTSIDVQTFAGCTSLATMVIPSTITSVAFQAFYGCTNLTEIDFQGNAPDLGSSVFDGDGKATAYYLPGTTGWAATFGGIPAVLYQTTTGNPPSLDIQVKSVQVILHVTPTKRYQLQASTDLKTWNNVGAPFVASTAEIVQEFNSIEVGRFFRIQEVP